MRRARIKRRRVISSLTCAALVSLTAQSGANSLAGLFGLGGDSGKIAKFEFRLRESIDVTAVAWSPNGRYLATASTLSNLIHVWDVKQQSIVKELKLKASGTAYHNLAWSPDGRYLAACGKPVPSVYATDSWQDAGGSSLSVSGDCLRPVFSSDGHEMALLTIGNVSAFAVPSWQLLKTSERSTWGRGVVPYAVAYQPGTHTVVLAGSAYLQQPQTPPVGQIWLLRSDETVPGVTFQAYCCVGDGRGGGGGVISLAVSPDGRRIATGTSTGAGSGSGRITQSVHIFDAASGKLLGAPLDGVDFGMPTGLTYTPDGRFLIVGHEDAETKAVHLIDARSLEVVDVVHASDSVYDVAANPQGSEFAAGGGRQVTVWSLTDRH